MAYKRKRWLKKEGRLGRQRRYETLRKEGFLEREAHFYSRVPFKAGYIQVLRRGRREALRQAKARGMTRRDFDIQIIKSVYKGKWKPSATVIYAVMKPIETEWKKQHPSYKSPSDIKQPQIDRAERVFEEEFGEPSPKRI